MCEPWRMESPHHPMWGRVPLNGGLHSRMLFGSDRGVVAGIPHGGDRNGRLTMVGVCCIVCCIVCGWGVQRGGIRCLCAWGVAVCAAFFRGVFGRGVCLSLCGVSAALRIVLPVLAWCTAAPGGGANFKGTARKPLASCTVKKVYFSKSHFCA